MDLKTESCVKLLFFILLLIIIIQFILIFILCSYDYMDYMEQETRYETEWEPDTLRIISLPVWSADDISLYDDFYFAP